MPWHQIKDTDMKINLGHTIIVCGPSGSGKTFVVHQLCLKRNGISCVKSCTTRNRRPNESSSDYVFMTDPEFDEHVNNGDFIEHANVYGKKYGFLKNDVFSKIMSGLDIVLISDQQGVRHFRSVLTNVTSILIYADEEFIRSKLESRPGIEEDIKRSELDRDYLASIDESLFDEMLVNDGTENIVDELVAIYDRIVCLKNWVQ